LTITDAWEAIMREYVFAGDIRDLQITGAGHSFCDEGGIARAVSIEQRSASRG